MFIIIIRRTASSTENGKTDAHARPARHCRVEEKHLAPGPLAGYATQMAERPEQPTLAAVVRERLGLSWNASRRMCRSGRVTVDGVVKDDPALRVDAEQVEVDPTAPKRRGGVLSKERILYADGHIAVVNKPAGMLSVPYDGEKDTLVDQLRAALRRRTRGFDPPLGIVHRLDKGTSGVLVFSRNLAAKKHLQGLFRRHDIQRRYIAIAHGHAGVRRHESWLIANRGDGLRGSFVQRPGKGKRPQEARRAITHVRSMRPLKRASELVLELETGRQHQIRIHLSEAGHPLVGEPVYIRDFRGTRIEAPRPMLHAFRLGFEHPNSGERVEFEVPPPDEYADTLASLEVD